MADLHNIVYISNEDYETLVTTGSVTIGDNVYAYDPNDVYITPQEEGEGLPSYDSSKENYVLSVDGNGNLTWRAPYNGEHSNG